MLVVMGGIIGTHGRGHVSPDLVLVYGGVSILFKKICVCMGFDIYLK